MDADLATASACELARRVQRREVSPVELVEGYLERIERLDGELNSVVALAPERARAEARAARDRAGTPEARPFDGVPTAIKDLHCTRGLTTTFATAALADFVPDFDEEHVARLRRAGFVVLGKTNVPEWGTQPVTESRLHGAARNPWDLGRSPGGSSGGAAAALAAGLVPVAQGSDGGGSIRIPASCCGVVGLKPSRGRVSLAPLFGDQLAGLVTPGPITRDVVDAAALLDVLAGYVAGDPHWAPEPARPFAAEPTTEPGALRVGLVTSSPVARFDADTAAAAESAADLLGDLGHAVEPLELALSHEVREHFATLWVCGIASLPLEPEQLEPFNAHHARTGAATPAPRLLQAINALQLTARHVVATCLAYDVVIAPTLTRPPLPIGALDGLDPEAAFDAAADYVGLSPLANITGQPAVSLPVGWAAAPGRGAGGPGSDGAGLPIGVTLTGRPGDEATLLRVAGQLQRAVDWPSQRPPAAGR